MEVASETATTPDRPTATTDSYAADPACWGRIDENVSAYWARKGPVSCQNKEANVKASECHYKHQKRLFSKTHFKRKHLNGESLPREWLLYSPSTGCVFCFACRLFCEGDGQSPFESGYNDWKHATRRFGENENSDRHRKAMFNYINRAAADGFIDSQLKKQLESYCNYWSEVLRRVVAVVKFLSERGLAFRGSSEIFSRADNGNYMGILELISEFDPFLKSHIQMYGNARVGTPSYLSSKTCEEFIKIMGDRLLSEIIAEVKVAKYFSISIDSTPDITHINQLTFIIRYALPEGVIEERFLKFLPVASHTGKALCDAVLTVLHEMDINICNCRGQCYDNAANMSGVYNGLQAHIKDINPLAEWVPCAAHTFNLVGINSVNCCTETADF
ncbi:zinc finger MYM-type protein 1-like [Sinocyclocheilus anshuiensis]|uniref:zinc finger MYM-type protein 1-like n=1 Tax=Sinocyclocheilus anshuiensis TaxID=1608454 RepID=UPI0007B985F2|nr:PREDICTED: zinc finger MYM-type protein 1-like [Sinocyclocheilus anshuiensis]